MTDTHSAPLREPSEVLVFRRARQFLNTDGGRLFGLISQRQRRPTLLADSDRRLQRKIWRSGEWLQTERCRFRFRILAATRICSRRRRRHRTNAHL